jgi:hypothetical protein
LVLLVQDDLHHLLKVLVVQVVTVTLLTLLQLKAVAVVVDLLQQGVQVAHILHQHLTAPTAAEMAEQEVMVSQLF